MIASVDVGYNDNTARAACVTFGDWDAAEPTGEFVLDIDQVEPYVPGQFYRRELPCVLAILAELIVKPAAIVIDGYVYLDDAERKGLGGHLFEALNKTTPVIGVAKTRFATATSAVEVFRGASDRPLFVTAAGVDQNKAADRIRQMHGENRIPTLLKRVDQLSRIKTVANKA
jgi:deoxyribonuclease V